MVRGRARAGRCGRLAASSSQIAVAALACAVALAGVACSTAMGQDALALQACINHNQQHLHSTTWGSTLSDDSSRMKVQGVWWSTLPRSTTDLTLLTHLTLEQKWQLKALCRSWRGPLSAVIHLATLKDRAVRHASPVMPPPAGSPLDQTGVVDQGDAATQSGAEASQGTDGGPEPAARRGLRQTADDDLGSETTEGRSGRSKPHAQHEGARKGKQSMRAAVKEAVGKARDLHASLERLGACQADIMLVQEVYIHEPQVDDRSLSMFPGALLQNYARLQARTPLVAYVEVDMIVGSNLFGEVQQLNATLASARRPQDDKGGTAKVAWVLPTFLVSGTDKKAEAHAADRLAESGDKEQLLLALREAEKAGMDDTNQVLVARLDHLLASHLPTSYNRWLQVNEPYRILYDEWYEPFVVVDRLGSAWADQRFRGYSTGRAALTLALHVQGYRFVAHPRAFLIYRPHAASSQHVWFTRELVAEAERVKAAARRRTQWEQRDGPAHPMKHDWLHTQSMLSHNTHLLNLVSGAADQGVYRPVVDALLLSCMEALPWWGPAAAAATRSRVHIAGQLFAVTDWDPAEGDEGGRGAAAAVGGEGEGGSGGPEAERAEAGAEEGGGEDGQEGGELDASGEEAAEMEGEGEADPAAAEGGDEGDA